MTETALQEPTRLPSSADAETPASPALVLVSTPIGNLRDFSERGRAALEAADAVLCEDTRSSAVLLNSYGIKTKLVALHEHNEDSMIPRLLAAMQAGSRYALISDAGTPLVSDPGYRLTRAVIAAGLPISGVPGANAAVLALTLSGLPPQPFLFLGFLPPKAGPRRAAFERLRNAEAAGLSATAILYEAPHRLAECLADAAALLGDRPAAVCRELSKRFEEIRRDGLAALAAHYSVNPVRGEVTLVIGPAAAAEVSAATLDESLIHALEGLSLKDAVNAVTAATGLARKQVYARALALSRDQPVRNQ
jgi:16S rRNA (cytidine1402-2'-O)-methyltransferase